MKFSTILQSAVFLITFSAFCFTLSAQDTILVNAITYDSTARDVIVAFPESGEYRKVELLYSMRCHDLAVGNGAVGCREWDYHCNTVVTVPERADSILRSHPSSTITNWDEETFYGTTQQTYQTIEYQSYLGQPQDGSVISQLGQYSETMNLQSDQPQSINLIYTGAELSAAGVTAGDIHGITLPLSPTGEQQVNLQHLTVFLGGTDLATIESDNPLNLFADDPARYYSNTTVTGDDTQVIFGAPYSWDGESNLAVSISYQSSDTPVSLASHPSSQSTLRSSGMDRFAAMTSVESWLLQNDFSSIENQVTISFWSYGDNSLPKNNSILEGSDASGNRQVNVHLPWSNASIFWDCGNDGSNYDRLSKAATFADFKNDWVHWTFVKDLNQGLLRIYKNGVLWTESTGNVRPIDIQSLVMGANINGVGGYHGYLDNFRVWKVALSPETVQDYLYKEIDEDHPSYVHLIAEYRFDEEDASTISDSGPQGVQSLSDYAAQTFAHGTRGANSLIFKNLEPISLRPSLSLVQQTGISAGIFTAPFTDSIPRHPHQVNNYEIIDGNLELTETLYLYETDQANAMTTIEVTPLNYYLKSEARYEILSFITPYGNGLDLGPDGVQFTIDMTDYLPILKGDRRLTIEGVGRNQEEMDLTFRFITGKPARDVLDIQQIWPIKDAASIWFGNGFGDIKNDNVFEPRTTVLMPEGDYFKLRSAVTGHGQNGEFTNQRHYLDIDGGFREFQYNVWKECADNPMYPQGGTWIYDRAGWCPGMETDVHTFNVSEWASPGDTITLDYGLVNADPGSADYRVSNQLVSYGPLNYSRDAELTEVIRPTQQYEYQRLNPACNTPLIMVKNNGTDVINSLDIHYQVTGGAMDTYSWTGNLFPEQEVEIELPMPSHSFWGDNSEARFEVSIINVNGSTDENIDNNTMTTVYQPVHIFERNFRIALRTNQVPFNNSYTITNSSGEEVVKSPGFMSNTDYLEDIDLPGGCYTFTLRDTGDDGLSFWANPAAGNGFVRMDELNDDGGLQYVAWQPNPDFGGDLSFDFMVRGTTDVNDIDEASILSIAPVPTQGELTLYWQHDLHTTGQLTLADISGRQVHSQEVKSGQKISIDTNHLRNGNYLVRIQHPTGVKTTWMSVVK